MHRVNRTKAVRTKIDAPESPENEAKVKGGEFAMVSQQTKDIGNLSPKSYKIAPTSLEKLC
jgi:hypothetical protein